MTRQIIRMLFIPRERFPNNRVNINVLFGRELLSRGHEIDVVMQAQTEAIRTGAHDWFGRTLWVGPTDSRDGFLHRVHKHWLGIRHDLRALRSAHPSRYDAVLISDKFLIAALAVLVARRRRLKFLYWLTFPFPEIERFAARTRTARYPWIAWLRGVLSGWLLYRWILPRCDHAFVQSERMKESIRAHGISPEKMSPITMGFGLDEIRPVQRSGEAKGEGPVTVGYLGTLAAERHLDILLEMLALLRAQGADVKLLLVGDADRPKDRKLFEEHAAALGVMPHMEITGFLPRAQALERIGRADIAISPIWRSPLFDVGSPTKMIEYMALALPMVANDHPEQKQILRESRAGVCVPWNARHFARAVRWLMKRSAAERAEMGARGRAWVEANRTYARIADEVERTCIRVIYGESSAASSAQGPSAAEPPGGRRRESVLPRAHRTGTAIEPSSSRR